MGKTQLGGDDEVAHPKVDPSAHSDASNGLVVRIGMLNERLGERTSIYGPRFGDIGCALEGRTHFDEWLQPRRGNAIFQNRWKSMAGPTS